jgi:hypothetical protein
MSARSLEMMLAQPNLGVVVCMVRPLEDFERKLAP